MTELRIGIGTCSELPNLDADAQCLVDALTHRGSDVSPIVWSDDLSDGFAADKQRPFAAIVIRSTWDYQFRRDQFIGWASHYGSRLFNSAPVVSWNTDKAYLRELAAAGLPIVPFEYCGPNQVPAILPNGRFVIKPAVSAGSKDTALYDSGRLDQAYAHLRYLSENGRAALIQPYVDSVETVGETAVIMVDGVACHAMRKDALLSLDQPFEDGLFRQEVMSLRAPADDEVALAEASVSWVAARFGEPLYARADILRLDDGTPALIELELTEPSLFLDSAPDTADRLAEALLRRLPPSRLDGM